MRFVKIVGSKQCPLKKNKSNNPSIQRIDKEFKDGQLYLKAIGKNLEFLTWKIILDNKDMSRFSKENVLRLSKEETLEYIKADTVSVTISVGKYVSPSFNI